MQIYAYVLKKSNEVVISELFLDKNGKVIAHFEVDLKVCKQSKEETLKVIPEKMILGNMYVETNDNKLVKQDF